MQPDNYIVLGLHHPEKAVVEIKEVGPCIICEQPVYLATQGVDGELEIKEIKELGLKKLVGLPCLLDLVTAFTKLMARTPEERVRIVGELLKKETLR
jgi:hypothetical protein